MSDHDDEPPFTDEERVWLIDLVNRTGPEGAYMLADLLGIDLDD
ncbi:hypothetical protein [Nocardiopsis sp. LOL_012]